LLEENSREGRSLHEKKFFKLLVDSTFKGGRRADEALLVEMKEIAKRQTSETKRIEEDFTVHISLLAL
jgi:hypothetical protein